MKLYQCKLMGTVDSDGCYACFMSRSSNENGVSRVLCKKTNVTEVIESAEVSAIDR
ncbi:MAG: hypothetical protein JNL74_02030 [Fibrobacteres bacterium]|nr:hypothetical protein [Fibrobacterota bacterium]